jgi:hypothetical protein
VTSRQKRMNVPAVQRFLLVLDKTRRKKIIWPCSIQLNLCPVSPNQCPLNKDTVVNMRHVPTPDPSHHPKISPVRHRTYTYIHPGFHRSLAHVHLTLPGSTAYLSQREPTHRSSYCTQSAFHWAANHNRRCRKDGTTKESTSTV